MNNPYAAPTSVVRDVEPKRLLAERPREVLYATLSVWLSVLVSVPLMAREFAKGSEVPGATIVAATFVGLALVFMAVANVAMWRGRNWARIAFLILAVIDVFSFMLELRETLRFSAIEIVLTVLSTGLDVAGSYFLFTKPGSLWFRTVQEV